MTLWVDAQLSPALAPWISGRFGIRTFSVKYLGYRDSTDEEIFQRAREEQAVMMTKDSDFVRLLEEHGPPPQVLWVTLGNTSNAHMRNVLDQIFPDAMILLQAGEPLVEISEPA